jgi:dGTPase
MTETRENAFDPTTPSRGLPSDDELRLRLEERERAMLSPHAAFSSESRGRTQPEDEHPYRTAFQRDRDRILHTKAFRRLKRKTQVFLATQGDHFRTRLTHTLEVSQIARTAARALLLNEDLVEAIAMGHDLGHTPFGHAGEAVLNEAFEEGFHHSAQSLRIVEKLESTRHGKGLNLSFEVLDGIRNHSRGKALLAGKSGMRSATLEGDVLSVCDAIAYINHDIDDAIRGGLITIEDLPREAIELLGRTSSERINAMTSALIAGSQDGQIDMTREVREATWELRSYLYANLYPCPEINKEIQKGKKIVGELYDFFLQNPGYKHSESVYSADPQDSLERRTVDIIAGMTDNYAVDCYRRLFFPETYPGW